MMFNNIDDIIKELEISKSYLYKLIHKSNIKITKTKRKQEDFVKYLPVFSKADYWLYLY